MGLTLAIPALIACYLFRLKLKGFHLASIEYGYRFLDSRPETIQKNNNTAMAVSIREASLDSAREHTGKPIGKPDSSADSLNDQISTSQADDCSRAANA
jgi:hypothetical protein